MSSTYHVEFENPTGDSVPSWTDDAHSFAHAAEQAVFARCPNRTADIWVTVAMVDDSTGEKGAKNRFRVTAQVRWLAVPETD